MLTHRAELSLRLIARVLRGALSSILFSPSRATDFAEKEELLLVRLQPRLLLFTERRNSLEV